MGRKKSEMRVIIDRQAGFCPGVKQAINTAEQRLDAGKMITALGSLIHNDREIGRLQEKGLHTVSQSLADDDEALKSLAGQEVLVRTHGIGAKVYERLEKSGIITLDGTCPTVKRVQKKVTEHHLRGEQIVIVGKKGHAEVIGLLGHCDGQGIVVEESQDLDHIDASRPTLVVAQTTVGQGVFQTLSEQVAARVKRAKIVDTTCRFISRRYEQIREFASSVDVLIFIGGRESSNSKVLFEICRAENARSFKIESAQELDPAWFEQASAVGITGGASTPVWQFEEVQQHILSLPR